MRLLFAGHGYGDQTTLGKIEHLKAPSIKDMYSYYKRWYCPENMSIFISGDVDPQQVKQLAEKVRALRSGNLNMALSQDS